MFDRATSRLPIGAFSTPLLSEPKPVAQAREAFDRVSTTWARVRGELDDAREAVKVAVVADREATTATYLAGKDPSPPVTAQQDAVTDLIADLEARLPGLEQAVDQAGNMLCQAIAEHTDDWVTKLAMVEVEAAARFDKGLAATSSAHDDLAHARDASTWLSDFSASLAIAGQQRQYVGGRVAPIPSGKAGTQDHDPRDLLRLLTQVTRPEHDEQARTWQRFERQVA